MDRRGQVCTQEEHPFAPDNVRQFKLATIFLVSKWQVAKGEQVTDFEYLSSKPSTSGRFPITNEKPVEIERDDHLSGNDDMKLEHLSRPIWLPVGDWMFVSKPKFYKDKSQPCRFTYPIALLGLK